MSLLISFRLVQLTLYFLFTTTFTKIRRFENQTFEPVKMIAPWVKLLVPWRLSEYNNKKVQSWSFMLLARMVFMVLYSSRKCDWELNLFCGGLRYKKFMYMDDYYALIGYLQREISNNNRLYGHILLLLLPECRVFYFTVPWCPVLTRPIQ